MAVYYWIDHAKDEEWEPLLLILAEVDQTFAKVVRVLIKLKKIWARLRCGVGRHDRARSSAPRSGRWTTCPAGCISAAGDARQRFADRAEAGRGGGTDHVHGHLLLVLAEDARRLWTSRRSCGATCSTTARPTRWRRTCSPRHERQFDQDDDQDKLEQFQAFALGWIAHIGTDVIAHSFVNEQAGGPFRTHWQRHHLVENHIDAWNYRQARADGRALCPRRPGGDEVYPDLAVRRFVYAVALDEENPNGWERPATLPDDRAAAKDAVDQDGFMPEWLAKGIVRALIATYHVEGEPQPTNLGGSDFQAGSAAVKRALKDSAQRGRDQPEPADRRRHRGSRARRRASTSRTASRCRGRCRSATGS